MLCLQFSFELRAFIYEDLYRLAQEIKRLSYGRGLAFKYTAEIYGVPYNSLLSICAPARAAIAFLCFTVNQALQFSFEYLELESSLIYTADKMVLTILF